MEKTWRNAIIKVLKDAKTALHYSDITEVIIANEYYKSDGATPAATVNALIATSIIKEGEKSPFIRVSPGIFSLSSDSLETDIHANLNLQTIQSADADSDNTNKFIHAFGMYWERELVDWKNNSKIFGSQLQNTKPIDFSKQRGVYLLYDHHTPVYVGRSTKQAISDRLLEHTKGRIAGRWNRFSWFGILKPTDSGELSEINPLKDESAIISVLEAVLIETLEPSQNRRQGDGLTGLEYIQAIDPEIKNKHLQAAFNALQKLNVNQI